MSITAQSEHPVGAPEFDGLIVKTSDTCGGKARIVGTRIWVRLIHELHEVQNLSVAAILDEYPHLTKAGIYAALAYYWSHPDEMRQEEEREGRIIAALEAGQPSLLDRIAARRPDVLQLSTSAALAYVASGRCPPEDQEKLRQDLDRRSALTTETGELQELRTLLTLNLPR